MAIKTLFVIIVNKLETVNKRQKITVEMSQAQYKRFLAFCEAEKIVRGIKKGLKEVQQAREAGKELKCAYELANELK